MLFASAGFLFAFLPLFLLIFMVAPKRAKRAVVLLGSILFYVLANLHSPFSILVLWAAVLFHYFAAMLLRRRHDLILLCLLIAVDLAAFFSLRLLCNQTLEHYYFIFPVGASIYLLSGISYLIDHYRDSALPTDNLVQTALYLTFFPVMLAGPLIRFRDFLKYTENFSFHMNDFARGARLLTVGLAKCMGVAAVLTEAYDNILQYSNLQVNIGIGLLSLAMMYLIVFFAFSGYSDMGVGICIMLGMPVRRDYRNPLTATSLMGYLRGFFASFYEYMKDYVLDPLAAMSFATPRLRRALGKTLLVLSLTLWFRVDFRFVLIALPLLIAVLLEECTPLGGFLHRHWYGKALGWLMTLVVAALFWTMQKLGSYATFGEYLRNLLEVSGSYQSLYTYATSIGSDFIIVAAIALAILMPLSHTGNTISDLMPARARSVADSIISVILMGLLILTLVYFMPQYPQYAVDPYAYFVI